MANKKNAGAPLKFPNTKTKTLRISRVVPEKEHNDIKEKTNALISRLQSEALSKCVSEVYKE